MPKLVIDGLSVEVETGVSVLQACEKIGIEVPRFCYHDRLSVAGCCRMCLVEIEKMPKPVASCAMPCSEGMVVFTDTPNVRAARADVMELLLLNHPLDCPECDQGGACDLQDQAFAYGYDRGHNRDQRRVVLDKNIGPLIKTCMTRCIHCMRCVRFLNEIAGTPELGGLFRGEHMEIDTGHGQALTTELSGNLIDICPVGALTSKPTAFQFRPWELKKTPSIDVMDAVGSNITIETRDDCVQRILPRENNAINGIWINDKTRFACDALALQRLDQPMIRDKGKLRVAQWDEALELVGMQLHKTPPERIAALGGDFVDCESFFALKYLLNEIDVPHMDCRVDGAMYDCTARAGYIMNTPIADIDKADVILLIGTNPRWEASMINARIYQRSRKGGLCVGVIGPDVDLSYPYRHIGVSPVAIRDVLEDKSPFSRILRDAKNPMIILGAGALARPDGAAIQALTRNLAESICAIREDWNGFNVLQTAAGRVGGLDIGFLPHAHGLGTNAILQAAKYDKIEVVYLLGADDISRAQLGNAFVVYQGHHGDVSAQSADVIFPATSYTEKDATYVNCEGRPQRTAVATRACGDAKTDWKIIRALSEATGHKLPFDHLDALREKMAAAYSHLKFVNSLVGAPWVPFGKTGTLTLKAFEPTLQNFYMTDIISRHSPTMARCVEEIGPIMALFDHAKHGEQA